MGVEEASQFKLDGRIRGISLAPPHEQAHGLEYRIIRADGNIRWVFEKGQGVFGEADSLQCLGGVILDITDRKRAEEQLERLATDPQNYLAKAALVWTYYHAGKISKAEQLYEQLKDQLIEPENKSTRITESDIAQIFLSRLNTYAPGDADQRTIDSLSKLIDRHRLWGVTYFARAEAYARPVPIIST